MNRLKILVILFLGLNLLSAQEDAGETKLIPIQQFLHISGFTIDKVPKEALVIKGTDTLIRHRLKFQEDPDLIFVPYDYRSEQFTDLYQKIAFQDPNVKDTIPARMRYWKDEMRIYFSGEVDRKDQKALTRFAEQIAESVDSLKIKIVNKLEDSNYVVYYSGHYEYEPRISRKNTVDYYLYWKGPYMNKGFLRIDRERFFNDEERLQNLKYYFVKTLGYFSGTKALDCGSYFSSCSDVSQTMSALDLELLQYHYSYGICKGVTLEVYREQLENANRVKGVSDKYLIGHYKSMFAK